ncbi:MAG: beta-glucosidase, partial [Spirochaetes bacterium]
RLSAKTIVPEDSLDVIVKVENTGKRAGSEVVQVYVADTESRLPRPKKELKGFAKVELEPGEAVETTIRLNPRAFCYWDSEAGGTDSPGAWVAEPGEFRILVGRNSGLIESENKVRLSR